MYEFYLMIFIIYIYSSNASLCSYICDSTGCKLSPTKKDFNYTHENAIIKPYGTYLSTNIILFNSSIKFTDNIFINNSILTLDSSILLSDFTIYLTNPIINLLSNSMIINATEIYIKNLTLIVDPSLNQENIPLFLGEKVEVENITFITTNTVTQCDHQISSSLFTITCTVTDTSPESVIESMNWQPIVGGCVGAAIVLVAIISTVFIYKRTLHISKEEARVREKQMEQH